jgi:N-acetyl-anhydromuramyl-L-alanine amidase AmpD
MKETQWRKMAQVAAELCAAYGIAVKTTTVLGHGEVETILGIAQAGKWDPMVLPWDTKKTKAQVGDEFRQLVTAYGGGVVPAPVTPPPTGPVPVPYPGTAVKQGSKGPNVKAVQQKIKALGSPIRDDGDFGPRTHTAVEMFQRSKGLTPDGVVGPKTWAALFG